ncbi:MAG: transcription elongation factor spt5 [Phylliscum demangeonii]|nr:MAG: transcription elongation factor spt5 [Phylliscum demangeonii]
MATVDLLDQDFGSESEGDFNPAPADDSENEDETTQEKRDGQPSESPRGRSPQRSSADLEIEDPDKLPTRSAGNKDKPSKRNEDADAEADVDADGEDEDTVDAMKKGVSGENEGAGDDDEDDDEQDDEEEEEEEERSGHRRKRRKDRTAQALFDVEAEVDEDEDELEDEEDELKEGDGFIADTHPDDLAALPSGRDGDDRRHRELDRRREVEATMDAERQAEELRKRYRRNRGVAAEVSIVPKRLLLPGVDDPNIWGIKCKQGKEREVVFGIIKRIEERAQTRSPLEISAVFERANAMQGYVYVEARSEGEVLKLLDGLSNVYPRSGMVLVPIKEMPDLLRTKKSKPIEVGDYVRIKRGKYTGDLAQVHYVVGSGFEVGIRLVPRLDYGLNEDANAPSVATAATGSHDVAHAIAAIKASALMSGSDPSGAGLNLEGKRKRFAARKAKPKVARPPLRLFSEMEARKKHTKYLSRTPDARTGTWNYLNDTYQDGYLTKELKIHLLQMEAVNPTLEEVARFTSEKEKGADVLDLNSMTVNLKARTANAIYIPGEMVEVYDSDQLGLRGLVTGVHDELVAIEATDGELKGHVIEVPVKGLRKYFREGDHVKVEGGSRFRDEVGMVIKIEDDRVTLLSDSTLKEVTVFNRDVRKAADSGRAGGLGKFDLFDLVQLDPATVGAVVKLDRDSLQVMDQNGSVRTFLPSQISNRLEGRRHAVATDRNGSEIRTDDTVREIGGEGRSGVIRHIHRSFLFVLAETVTENAGLFVVRATNVATVAAKGARPTNSASSGPDLSKMNPALLQAAAMNGSMPPPAPRPMGRDRVLGRTVTIRRGPYKGLLGIVVDATDFEARVELHARSKIVAVPKECLGVKDDRTGQITSYAEFSRGQGQGPGRGRGDGPAGYGGPPSYGGPSSYGGPGSVGGRTPAHQPDEWQGGRTPMAAASHLPARTPGWGAAAGSRTPAAATGFATAMHTGRTPAWKHDALGGRTPGFGIADGGRTPGFGGQTSYGGPGDGGRTPFAMGGMGGMGSKTPGWGTGGQTAYGGLPTYDPYVAGSRTPGQGMAGSWNPAAAGGYAGGGGGSTGGYAGGGGGSTGGGVGGYGGGWQGSRTPGHAPADPSYS